MILRNYDLVCTEYNILTKIKSNLQVGVRRQTWTAKKISPTHPHGRNATLSKLALSLQDFFDKKSIFLNDWDEYITHGVTGMLS